MTTPTLNSRLKERLRALVEQQSGGLSAASQDRVALAMSEQGPGLYRRAVVRRRVVMVAPPALALAAVALLAVMRLTPTPENVAGTAPVAVDTPAVPALEPRACEGRTVEVAAGFVADGAGVRRVDLGSSLAVLSADAEAELVMAEACVTRFVLSHGRISVHARDLGGGELRVVRGDDEVVVHGTVFAVEVARDSGRNLRVQVAEGRVAVRRVARAEVLVDAGNQLVDRVPEELGVAEQRSLLAVVGLGEPLLADPPVRAASTRADPIDPDAILARAEVARRRGDLRTARKLYRQVGRGEGAGAQAAWLSLGRLELAAGKPLAAKRALSSYRRRFGEGRLGPEAWSIALRVAKRLGDRDAEQRAIDRLLKRYPRSPQAKALAAGR